MHCSPLNVLQLSTLSLGNFGTPDESNSTERAIYVPVLDTSVSLELATTIISWSDFGIIIACLIFVAWWKIRVKTFTLLFDESNITMADYAVVRKKRYSDSWCTSTRALSSLQ